MDKWNNPSIFYSFISMFFHLFFFSLPVWKNRELFLSLWCRRWHGFGHHTLKFYIKVFLSSRQGSARRAILYGERSCTVLKVCFSTIFSSPVWKYRVLLLSLMLALAWIWASHFKVLHQSFLCDGQGADRQAILYEDMSCFNRVQVSWLSVCFSGW